MPRFASCNRILQETPIWESRLSGPRPPITLPEEPAMAGEHITMQQYERAIAKFHRLPVRGGPLPQSWDYPGAPICKPPVSMWCPSPGQRTNRTYQPPLREYWGVITTPRSFGHMGI
ncbi:hypothetical protein LA080_009922 [Diaporthe eres]|nr:hypothetical protein LA080_009922 [Diaporthe eres]